MGFIMKVKIFDESHERDLELKVNDFLRKINKKQLLDIKYQVALMYDEREQIYCFSCMIIYDDNIELNNSKSGSM